MVIVDMVKQKSRAPAFGDADGFENNVRAYAMPNGAPVATPQVAEATAPAMEADIPF